MTAHKCLAGCGRAITWQFALCAQCEQIHGSSSYDWPEWLRFLWKETLRERRQEVRIGHHEVQVDMENFLEYESEPAEADN